MNERIEERIAEFEDEIARDPASAEARANLLEALSSRERFNDPRRIELIAWFIEHHPGHYISSTPFMSMDHEAVPDQYRELKARWLSRASEPGSDPQLSRGAAAFIVVEDAEEARRLLRAAIDRNPRDATLWLDLGRYSVDARERLAALERAREAGEKLTSLLAWIGMSAIKAGEYAKAEQAARDLLKLVERARARYGDKLDWPEKGGAIWTRAREASPTRMAASRLISAITDHAYRKHWAHTILGLLACHDDDLDRALTHLKTSADVRPDYRLSSYGPSLDLVREVCARGRWEDGLQYLRAWEQAWDDPRLQEWIAAVGERRLPDADTSD